MRSKRANQVEDTYLWRISRESSRRYLQVEDTYQVVPLFRHTWNRQGDLADETLFSGMIQGITGILKESLKRGDVQEIHMADAIIIAYRIPE
ncbi:MAG TPA: hypothetical protein VKK79_25940 [Candidatus Lokiarchaeia archaeon]|nr:hypothetical protein [Candidatus Lokiarchaeia archaeon]